MYIRQKWLGNDMSTHACWYFAVTSYSSQRRKAGINA